MSYIARAANCYVTFSDKGLLVDYRLNFYLAKNNRNH